MTEQTQKTKAVLLQRVENLTNQMRNTIDILDTLKENLKQTLIELNTKNDINKQTVIELETKNDITKQFDRIIKDSLKQLEGDIVMRDDWFPKTR